MGKQWTIPTILRELRRVVIDAGGPDIMTEQAQGYQVDSMVEDLKQRHLEKEMQIPGQLSITDDDGSSEE